jgi:hypothetical protein
MASQECDGCGEAVTIAGGISGLWSSDNAATGGIELELVDGTQHFLCYDCVERLPDEGPVTAEDVSALERD